VNDLFDKYGNCSPGLSNNMSFVNVHICTYQDPQETCVARTVIYHMNHVCF